MSASFHETRALVGLHAYAAGSDGHVYSIKGWRGDPFRRLAEGVDPDGYPNVQVSAGPGAGGRSQVRAVHRLIAIAFLPPRPSFRHEIRHLDGQKTNNVPANLRWGTQKENADDRERHGRTARGERQSAAKLTEAAVVEIRRSLRAGATHKFLAERFGVSMGLISHIKSGISWAHVRGT